jgi:hypothetical protein
VINAVSWIAINIGNSFNNFKRLKGLWPHASWVWKSEGGEAALERSLRTSSQETERALLGERHVLC